MNDVLRSLGIPPVADVRELYGTPHVSKFLDAVDLDVRCEISPTCHMWAPESCSAIQTVKSEYKRRALDALAEISPRYWKLGVSAYHLRDVIAAFRSEGIDSVAVPTKLIASLTRHLDLEMRLTRELFNVARINVRLIDVEPLWKLSDPVACAIEVMQKAAKPFWAKPPQRVEFLQAVVQAYAGTVRKTLGDGYPLKRPGWRGRGFLRGANLLFRV